MVERWVGWVGGMEGGGWVVGGTAELELGEPGRAIIAAALDGLSKKPLGEPSQGILCGNNCFYTFAFCIFSICIFLLV